MTNHKSYHGSTLSEFDTLPNVKWFTKCLAKKLFTEYQAKKPRKKKHSAKKTFGKEDESSTRRSLESVPAWHKVEDKQY